MKCVILAAGFGSRLQPFTSHRPKQMLPVGGKPILLHGIEYIRDVLKIDEIVMVVGHQRSVIMDYFGTGERFGIKISYVIQHLSTKRGLGAALQLVEEYISSDFCLYLADNLFGADLRKVLDYHLEHRPAVTLHVEHHENPSRFGVVVTDDSNNITRVVEKPKDPPSDLVITGFYVFSPMVFTHLSKLTPSARGEYELTDAIQSIIESGARVKALPISGWRQDFGFAQDIIESNKKLMDSWGTTIKSDVSSCEVIEPVFIDEGCSLRDCTIGPYTTIGKNVVMSDSVASGSVVLSQTSIKSSHLSNSVIGSKCIIEGVKGLKLNAGDYTKIEMS